MADGIQVFDLNAWFGSRQVLKNIGIHAPANGVTALIGPSGCGKTTFLRTLNRMSETVAHARAEGSILLDGENILGTDVSRLRRRVGMVFQRPNPFPKTIFE